MKKVNWVLTGLAIFFMTNAYATDITNIIAQNLKGSQILKISVEPLPHQDAKVLVVNTTTGEKRFIVTPDNLGKALTALKQPDLAANNNPVFINNQILAALSGGPVTLNSSKTHYTMPASQTAVTAPTPVPTQAPGIVASAVTSANQQASR